MSRHRGAARLSPRMAALQLVTAAALTVDAYVHADLASGYDRIGSQLSQGDLFRLEAAAASLAALVVLVRGRRRWPWLFAFLVAASALGAVLLYRYVDVGTLGPLPNMYEPVWFTEKTVSVWAEGVATVTAAAGLLVTWRRWRRGRAPTTAPK